MFTNAPVPPTQSNPGFFIAWPLRRRVILFYAGLAAVVVLAIIFRQTLTLAFAAFATAYVFAPLVRRVERFGAPRPLAVLLVLLTATAIVAAAIATLLPELLHQAESLVRSLPNLTGTIRNVWIPWLQRHLPLPPTTVEALRQLGDEVTNVAPRLDTVLSGTLEYGAAVVEYLFRGLVVFALTFYLLLDFESVLEQTYELIPHRARGRASVVLREIDETLRHFVTGQLVVMAVLGFLYALGLGLIGIPAGWAIGLVAGLISFVPYLGFVVALVLALFMAAVQAHGAGPVLAVIAVMSSVHILDLTLITPRILGGRAKLSPVVTILALIAGGSIFGFVGVLVAIPVASVARVLLREAIEHYKTTTFYTDGMDASSLQSGPFSSPPPASLRTDPTAPVYPTPPVAIQPNTQDAAMPTPRESNA